MYGITATIMVIVVFSSSLHSKGRFTYGTGKLWRKTLTEDSEEQARLRQQVTLIGEPIPDKRTTKKHTICRWYLNSCDGIQLFALYWNFLALIALPQGIVSLVQKRPAKGLCDCSGLLQEYSEYYCRYFVYFGVCCCGTCFIIPGIGIEGFNYRKNVALCSNLFFYLLTFSLIVTMKLVDTNQQNTYIMNRIRNCKID